MKWLKEDSYGFPILLAIGLHAGIVLTGIVAIDFSETEKQQPKRPVIVNATVIDISETVIGKREAQEKAAKKQAAVSAEKRKKEAAQKKQKEIERKALEKKKQQLAQAKKTKEKAVKESARKENERKQTAEKKRLEQENAKKQLAQETEKKRREKQAENDRKRKEQELIRQAEKVAEEERKREVEAAKLAEGKKQAEEAAAAQAAAEQEKQRAAEEAQMVQSISSLINSRVTAVWNRPPSARNGMKTQLRIYFLPNGEVRDVQVTGNSGDALFDQRAVDAVYKVGRIEELADVDSYTFERNFRQIDLIFNPQDLRN